MFLSEIGNTIDNIIDDHGDKWSAGMSIVGLVLKSAVRPVGIHSECSVNNKNKLR